MDTESVEVANRLLFMKSWSDWRSLDGEELCLTVQGWALSGTSCKVGQEIEKLYDSFTMDDLKLLTSGLVAKINQCSVNEYELGNSGFGMAVNHFGLVIKAAFTAKVEFDPTENKQNRLEVNLILGVKVGEDIFDVESQSSQSEDLDSMDSAKYYVERLRDFFDGF